MFFQNKKLIKTIKLIVIAFKKKIKKKIKV